MSRAPDERPRPFDDAFAHGLGNLPPSNPPNPVRRALGAMLVRVSFAGLCAGVLLRYGRAGLRTFGAWPKSGDSA